MSEQDSLPLSAVLDSPLPPTPPGDTLLTPTQWATLLAIADTIIPSVKPRSSANPALDRVVEDTEFNSISDGLQSSVNGENSTGELVQNFLNETPSSVPQFQEAICRIISNYVPNDGRKGIVSMLDALNTRPTCFLLTGSDTPLQLQPLHIRETILRKWSISCFSKIRLFQRSIVILVSKCWALSSPRLPPLISFPQTPLYGSRTKGFPYEFLQFDSDASAAVIDTDVVIIGSGCGAGVAAKNLAEAGHRVIVAEKSYHFSNAHFPMTQAQGLNHMFENGGAYISDDGSIALVAGSTWGGGGTVNWSASLHTQSFVRQEWADSGLPFFTSLSFQQSLDRVCDYMGVSTDHVEHNDANSVLLEGSRKLGYAAKVIPQNTGHKKHYCGHCMLGCAAGEKRGPAVSFLVDAARAGSQFIEGFTAEKVLFGSGSHGTNVATGVIGDWVSKADRSVKRRVIINAKKVIVSCGTLHSPLLLRRSGLKNRQIGRNLHLHPGTSISSLDILTLVHVHVH